MRLAPVVLLVVGCGSRPAAPAPASASPMDSFTWMVGTWTCPVTATRALHLAITRTADTLIIVDAVDGMSGRPAEVIHWDPVGRHYVEVFNGEDTTSSDGWQGDRLVFAGGMAGTAGLPVRYVTIRRSERELEQRVEQQTADGWQLASTARTCTRDPVASPLPAPPPSPRSP